MIDNNKITKNLCKRCVMPINRSNPILGKGCRACEIHLKKLNSAPFMQKNSDNLFKNVIENIKNRRKSSYDCIVGVSGGVDSSYIALKSKELGLNPLLVHVDNGWNSVTSYKNVSRLIDYCDFDLESVVLDWNEFRDIQRSFFFANVIDLELVTDHAIFASLARIARKHNIKYILSGTNLQTEGIMGHGWTHFKFDNVNIKDIHKKYGECEIKSFPFISPLELAFTRYIFGVESVSILNFIKYNKSLAKDELQSKCGWIDYGGKHYESIFTKVYQSIILPKKFNVDKRFSHFSNLILSGELTRERALDELTVPPYDEKYIFRDLRYLAKKLKFDQSFWKKYFADAPVPHSEYKSNVFMTGILFDIYKKIRY